MGASISNMGGGMVELFSWNSTDANPQVFHTITSEELTQFKEYCSEYDLIVASLSAEWTEYRSRCRRGTDPVIGVTGLSDFLNNTTANAGTYYVEYAESEASINIRRESTSSYIVKAAFHVGGSPTNASATLKIYGIKL